MRSHRQSRPRCPVSGLLAAVALFAGLLALPPAPAQAAGEESIKVVVALLPFRVHSAGSLDYLESSLIDLLGSRLEASGRVEVVESVIVREAIVAYSAGEMTEVAVRKLAEELDADYVVTGSLTELAGHYSLDVRVTPVDSSFASQTMIFTAEGDDELLDRVNELAERVIALVTRGPGAVVVGVRILGAERLDVDFEKLLLTREGEPYNSAAVREDITALIALADVAHATADTDRTEDGVLVTFRIVPAASLLAESEAADETDIVAEIRVTGNRRIETDAILARIGTKAGDPYRAARVAEDVRQIYALGFFRNVKVLSTESLDGRILTFEVEENPIVRRVTISGNDGIDSEEILDALTLTAGASLDYPLLYENQQRIAALYRAKGFYLAEVSHEIETLSGNAVAINFNVDEGKKLKLREIVLEGNEHFSTPDLLRGLHTKPWHWYSYATQYLDKSGTYSEPVFTQDLRTIEQKYMDAGYLKVEISSPEVDPEEDGLVVTVDIEEGDQFRTGEIDVEGDSTVDLEALRSQLLLKTGEVFNRSHLTADVERLTRYYTDRGFYFASVNPRTHLESDTKIVSVEFEVEKGPLYFVREIEFQGNTTTIDPVLRREMRSVEGQLYSARALQISQARLRNLGFFEDVEFEAKPTDSPGQIDMDVKVVERPTGSLSFGAGFSSQDKFVLTGSLAQTNLFGRGYGAQLSADVGGRSQRFFLSFSDPYFMDTEFSLATTIFNTQVKFEGFEQSQQGFDLVAGHSLNETNTARGFLRYSFSNRDLVDDSSINAASTIFRQLLNGETSSSVLGLTIRSDDRNDRVVPSAGGQISTSLDYAGLGGFSKFLRFEARIQHFWKTPAWLPVFGDRSTVMLAGRFGWAEPFNTIGDYDAPFGIALNDEDRPLDEIDTGIKLPLSERYFLGGLGSFQLRGYRARSVGPRRAVLTRSGLDGLGPLFRPVGRENIDVNGQSISVCTDDPGDGNQGNGNGKCNNLDDKKIDDFEDLDETDVIGGNKFFSLTAEYQFPISETLGLIGIVFFDMGNAFAEDEEMWQADLWRYGTGAGVLWFSPFGPLQAFLGFPLDPLSVEDPYVFEFSVGGASF